MLARADQPVRLRTERLLLRPPQPKDAARMHCLVSDIAVARTTGTIPHPYPPGAAQAFIRRLLAAGETATGNRPTLELAIARAEDDAFLGMVKITSGPSAAPANVAYYVGRPHWGQGYATEAVWAAIHFGFEQCGLDRFETAVFDGND